MDIAYKLVAFGNEPRMKLSAGKVTYPWPKQVFRQERRGEAVQDVLAIWGEDLPGQPLLETVMKSGERTEAGRRSIQVARARAHEEVSRLPARVRSLAGGAYPVQVSEQLSSQTQALAAKLATRV